MPAKKKSAALSINLNAFQGLLERTLDSLEQRVYGRLTGSLATKEDIQSLRQETKEDIQSLRQETKEDIQSLRQEMATLKDLNSFAATVKGEFERLEAKIDERPTRKEFLDIFEKHTKAHQKTHEKIDERLIKLA